MLLALQRKNKSKVHHQVLNSLLVGASYLFFPLAQLLSSSKAAVSTRLTKHEGLAMK